MDSNLIISVAEARKILGKDGENLTDDEITKLIIDLNVLARYAVQQFREKLPPVIKSE